MRNLLLCAVLALGGCGAAAPADPAAHDPTSPATTPAAPPTPEHVGWDVAERSRADVDGDGTVDEIRLRSNPDCCHHQLVVDTSELVYVLDLGSQSFPAVVFHGALDSEPGDELMLRTEDGAWPVRVVSLRDGELVTLDAPDRPVLAWSVDGDGRMHDAWVDDGDLTSTSTVEVCDVGWDTVSCPEPRRLRVWTWTVSGTTLVPHAAGIQCKVDSTRNLSPC